MEDPVERPWVPPLPALRTPPFGFELTTYRSNAAASAPELCDTDERCLFFVVGDEVPVLRPMAKSGRSVRKASLFGLHPTPGPKAGRDGRSLQLREHTDHQPHCPSHGIFGVVLDDLALVDGEHRAAMPPNDGKGCFLNCETASETIEPRNNKTFSPTMTDESKSISETGTIFCLDGAADAFIRGHSDDPVVVLLAPFLDRLVLDVEAEAFFGLAVGGDA